MRKNMEQTRKNLKLSSIAVLALAFFSLLQIVSELLYGDLNNAAIPEGAPENILLITKIFVFAVSLLLTLPNIYIGIKGLRIAKKPNSSKGHIVWAIILLAFASLSLIEQGVGFIHDGFKFENISAFCSIVVEVAVFDEYIRLAIAVRKTVA
jgi:uncharacterized membrane protein YhaH (DUF805 family)